MRTALRTQPALVVGKQLPKLFPCDSPSRGNVFFLRLFLRVKVIPGFENVNLYFWYLFYSWLSPFSSLFSKFRMDNFVTGAWCVREKCFISTRKNRSRQPVAVHSLLETVHFLLNSIYDTCGARLPHKKIKFMKWSQCSTPCRFDLLLDYDKWK